MRRSWLITGRRSPNVATECPPLADAPPDHIDGDGISAWRSGGGMVTTVERAREWRARQAVSTQNIHRRSQDSVRVT